MLLQIDNRVNRVFTTATSTGFPVTCSDSRLILALAEFCCLMQVVLITWETW